MGRRQGQAADLSRGHAAYFDQHEGKWKNAKHRTQFTNTLKQYAFPVLGDMAVADIDTPEVLRAIEPIGMTKTETASRVRGRIESVLDWCDGARLSHGRQSGALERPSERGVAGARASGEGRSTTPRMPYAELPAFMAELRKREGVAARALEFAILTAARTGEVIGARGTRSISRQDVDGTGRPHEGRQGAPGAVIGARHRAAARAADRGRQRFRLRWIARRHRFEQHDD